jgi:hypothetical protein
VYAIATFVVVAIISMIFTRVATGALIATGLPPEVAAFQARSAFTGAGFTTVEAENVVNHPVRRRVIATTMLVGNLGTPTLVVTVLIGFLAPGPGDTSARLLATLCGLVIVLVIANLRPVTRWLVEIGRRSASRRLIPAMQRDWHEIATLGEGFTIAEIGLERDPELTPRSLRGLDQVLGPLTLLGVRHSDSSGTTYVGEPPADLTLHAGDRLVVYGRRGAVESIASGGEAPNTS